MLSKYTIYIISQMFSGLANSFQLVHNKGSMNSYFGIIVYTVVLPTNYVPQRF